MSYCRWSAESSVYVYPREDAIVCCACSLGQPCPVDFTAIRRSDMLAHLDAHRSAGDRVPDGATRRLEDEVRMLGDEYQPDDLP